MPARVFSWLRVHHPGTPFVPPLGFVSRRRRAGSNSTDFWYRTFGVTSKILIVQCQPIRKAEKRRQRDSCTQFPDFTGTCHFATFAWFSPHFKDSRAFKTQPMPHPTSLLPFCLSLVGDSLCPEAETSFPVQF